MSCNAGRFVLQPLCKPCDLRLRVDRKHGSIDRKRVNIEGKPENIEGKPVRQCRGCVRSQQLWISSWQQERLLGQTPHLTSCLLFPVLPASLPGPGWHRWVALAFPGSLEGSQLVFSSRWGPASHRALFPSAEMLLWSLFRGIVFLMV